MEMPYRAFCCYASEDQAFLQDLKKHLRPLQREGTLIIQADINISPGKEREREVGHHLEVADIILLLISPDFINSDYCFDAEMRQAMARHQQGTARVVPVIIRPTDWQSMPFGKLCSLPKDAKPISLWENMDDAFLSVTRGIRTVVRELATDIPVNPEQGNWWLSSVQEEQLLSSGKERTSMDTTNNTGDNTVINQGTVHIGGQQNQVIMGGQQNTYIGGRRDGIRSLTSGSKALWSRDYPSAKKDLRVAIEEIDRESQPGEAAKARYFFALALLGGKLPRIQGRAVMQSIDELMNAAIELRPCTSNYQIFAHIKRNFFEYNGFKHRLKEVDLLEHEGSSLPPCIDDDENEEYFRRLQPHLQI